MHTLHLAWHLFPQGAQNIPLYHSLVYFTLNTRKLTKEYVMSFLFATSHLPAVKRPQDADEEEDNAQPMQRSGGVRAISHLEEADSAPETRSVTSARSADSAPPAHSLGTPTGTLSQRAAQSAGRSLFLTPRPTPPQAFALLQARRPASRSRSTTPLNSAQAATSQQPVPDTTSRPLSSLFEKPLISGFRSSAPTHPENQTDIPEFNNNLVNRSQDNASNDFSQTPGAHMVQWAAKDRSTVPIPAAEEDEPSHDKNLTAEQQKQFTEAMKNKALDLYYHHENHVGEKTPAAKTAKRDGKTVAYCNQYPSECVAAGYESIGMPKTAQMIRDKTTRQGQGVQHLAKILHGRGWKSIFYNNDLTSPGSHGEHASDTGMVEKTGAYWAPPRMGADGKLKTDWMKVDGHKTDFRPGRPGYSDEVTEDLKKLDFGVVAGCRGNHGAVMSNGGSYDVHRSEPDVNKLYGKSDFNQTTGYLQSGLLLIPPGGHIPSHTPAR